jgi:hypothetical protein
MKLQINKITRKEIDTKYGKKWKIAVFADNKWYGAWAQPWNRGWREGQTIDVEVKEREWNGKPQYDIVGAKGEASAPSSDLDAKITQIMIEVLEIKKMVSALALKDPEPF